MYQQSTPLAAAPLLPSQEERRGTVTLAMDAEDPSLPRAEYSECLWMWDLTAMLKEGTDVLRANSVRYLPKFQSEDERDYRARVDMTTLDDHYEQAVADLVGLAFAEPPTLKGDVPDHVKAILENVDGEGTAWDVFLQDTLDAAMDYGHAAIYTDAPKASGEASRQDILTGKRRPYWVRYRAVDIPNWRTTVIGGVRTLTMVTLREPLEEKYGTHGTKSMYQYRVIEQEVVRDGNDLPVRLGAITFRVMVGGERVDGGKGQSWTVRDEGTIVGPETIPLRIVYGGRKLGILRSRPHLIGLAHTNLEEVQVKSDYAAVMHKCNVPTPYFIGRTRTVVAGQANEVKMGDGIDLAIGGEAGFIEPAGTALDATRTRIEDIRIQMRRQGAALNASDGKLTATEAELFARQRNARLTRAVRSLSDNGNAALGDLAQFLGLGRASVGELSFSTNYSGSVYDPQFVSLVAEAYEKGALPLDAYLHALQKGKLPDDFNAEETALRMLAAALTDRAEREKGDGVGPKPNPDDEDDAAGGLS